MRAVKARAIAEVYSIYKRASRNRNTASAEAAAKSHRATTTISAPRVVALGAALEVEFTTTADHADTDWYVVLVTH